MSLTSRWWFISLVVVCGFLVGVYLYAPIDDLEAILVNKANDRLPDQIRVESLNFTSIWGVESLVAASIRGQRLEAPFSLTISPGFTGTRINLASPPASEPQEEPPLKGTYNTSSGTFVMMADSYPISNVIRVQSGEVSGRISGDVSDTVSAKFIFSSSIPHITKSPLFPPFVWGMQLQRLTGKGTIKKNKIRVTDLDLVSNQMLLSGNLNASVKRPLDASRISIDLKLKQPVQKRIEQSFQLKEVGI